MSKHKVLMLGWEYPPFINGGLGVACAGLCDALSELVSMTLIVPKVTEGQIAAKQRILGMNQLKEVFYEKLIEENVYREIEEIYKVNIQLDPYHSELKTAIGKKLSKAEVKKIKTKQKKYIQNTFNFDSLYGKDVIQKVIIYAEFVKKIAKDLEFDIIHAHDWMTFLAGVELKKITGKPLVLHVHSLDYDRAGSESRGWVYDVERSSLSEADLIFPVSNYTGNILISHYGVSRHKIRAIYNGIEADETFKKEKAFPEKMVLFIGRLTGQKGPEYFLDIATKIYKKFKNVRFVIAGTGEKLSYLLEDGAYRQIGSRVHFTGFIDREKIRELLSMADVYCMPSVSEPFGLTALEAANFDVPTVISERSGVAEVLTGSLKADFWDIDLMVSHILELLSNNNTRERVVKNNRNDLKKLTWKNAAKQVVEAYDKLLSKHKKQTQ